MTFRPPPSLAPTEHQGGNGWSYLHGGCFNLYLNLQILQGYDFADTANASKCYADLNVPETRLDVTCRASATPMLWT